MQNTYHLLLDVLIEKTIDTPMWYNNQGTTKRIDDRVLRLSFSLTRKRYLYFHEFS